MYTIILFINTVGWTKHKLFAPPLYPLPIQCLPPGTIEYVTHLEDQLLRYNSETDVGLHVQAIIYFKVILF